MISQRSKLIFKLSHVGNSTETEEFTKNHSLNHNDEKDLIDKENQAHLVHSVSDCKGPSPVTSPAPSIMSLCSETRKDLNEIIDEACREEDSPVENEVNPLLELLNDENIDDSDADPTYYRESSSESEEVEEHSQPINKRKRKNERHHVTAEESENKRDNTEIQVRKKRGRKPVKGETRNVREVRQKQRNLGESYMTNKGKAIRARVCKDLPEGKQECAKRISKDNRQSVFREYWSMGNFYKRVAHISALITTEEKRITTGKDVNTKHKNRQVTHRYHLRIKGELLTICKGCFLRTFDETNKFVTNVIQNKSLSTSGITHDDLRGQTTPVHKIPADDIDLVHTHILKLPSYESHYCRASTRKKYLPPYYTLARIYDEYKKYLPVDKKPVSRKIYETAFHNFGLKIKSPHKDTCATCDKYNMQLRVTSDSDQLNSIKNGLDLHQKEAEEAYNFKKLDKEACLKDSSKLVYTVDLQQCLPTPDLQSSVAFYKRQLWTYNFTLHRSNDEQAFCYMWHEAVAGRGANQIASCLNKHLETISPEVREITFYSDTCPGQNKNSFLPIMFMNIMINHPGLQYINHKFLVSGHTHMECDGDHSIIKKKKKKYPYAIEHPRDWVQLVRMCGQKKPFVVIEMARKDFLEYSALLKTVYIQKKVDEENVKFMWRDIKWLRYSQTPGIVEYKTTLDPNGPFKKINFLRKPSKPIPKIKVPYSYKGPVLISAEKKVIFLTCCRTSQTHFMNFIKIC